VSFKTLNEEDNYMLTTMFKEEVKKMVWECEGHKSLELNGFNFMFIKGM